MIAVKLEGLTLASSPIAGERWRVVVANVTRFKALAELLTLGFATTDTEEKAKGWFEGIASLGIGYPATQPVARGEIFVVDMKFSGSSTALLPLSAILQRWEQVTPGVQVIYVARVSPLEDSSAGVSGRAAALDAAAAELNKVDPITQIKEAGSKALGVLQLAFWAVIVGGGVYLVAKSGLLRKR